MRRKFLAGLALVFAAGGVIPLVGCGDSDGPKAKSDTNLKERPAPGAGGATTPEEGGKGKKGSGNPGAAAGVQ